MIVPSPPFPLSRRARSTVRRFASFMLLLLLTGIAQADPLGEAQHAQEAGDYARAATLYLPLASKGNPLAQFNLGLLFTQGLIIQKDEQAALQWFLAAADQGHAEAQARLGQMYAKGNGVPQDFRKAMHWSTLAAKQGNAQAQFDIAQLYANGLGVPQNHTEAVKWYRLAAEQGNAAAHAGLGECYEQGSGVTQDSAMASKWFASAASYANDEATRNSYLARRDAIEKGLIDRQMAKEKQLARIEAERVKAAEAAVAQAARIKAEQAATEQARLKAIEQAALDAQLQAKKQAEIEQQAARKKAELDAKAERKTRQRNELEVEMARRRAEINAEAARRSREIQAEKRRSKIAEARTAKIRHADTPLMNEHDDVPVQKPAPQARNNPVKPIPPEAKNAVTDEAHPTQVTGKIKLSKNDNRKYPAKTELTYEELQHPLMKEANEPGTGIPGKPLIKLKQIEWSKKPEKP
jgi:TPR repeat protein